KTILSRKLNSAITLRSRSRKPASPSTSKIQGMFAPQRASISLSESTNSNCNSLARAFPMVVLPAPIGPIKTMRRGGVVCRRIDVISRDFPQFQGWQEYYSCLLGHSQLNTKPFLQASKNHRKAVVFS